MKFLNLLAVAGCAALFVILSTTLYSCHSKASPPPLNVEQFNPEVVLLGRLYSCTVVQGKDTFYFNNVKPDLYKALQDTSVHLYIYDVYSPREKNYYNTWSEIPLKKDSWEIIEGDTVKVKSLLFSK